MIPENNFTPAPIKETVTHEDLDKLDVRVGTIERVENVAKSDKLIKLIVNFGDHTRCILVGMKKERLNPREELEGRQSLFVVNLAPRKMAGEISQGMMFDIGHSDGLLPVLAVPERRIANGSRAG